MTAGELDLVRALIDRAVRARLEPLQKAYAGIFYCSRCGIELLEWTPSCSGCWERHRRAVRDGRMDAEAFKTTSARHRQEAYAKQAESQRGKGRPRAFGNRENCPTWSHNLEALEL